MSKTIEQSGTQTAPPTPAAKREYIAKLKALPFPEKLLAAGALAMLLAFVIDARWNNFGWFEGLAVAGALGILLLTAASLRNGLNVGTNARTYVLVALAAAPALGFVIHELNDFWRFAMLASAVAMGYAAYKINARDDLL